MSEKAKPECPFCYEHCVQEDCSNICHGLKPECEKALFCTLSYGDDTCDTEKCRERLRDYVKRQFNIAIDKRFERLAREFKEIGNGLY